ncbi:MAG TPA: non-heme iron oxygenase ferredoxin subunit [Actinomycetaceae bacterium]|nr:non-heme iron oxygenase ferredoxin subunit [Actinomycetaceae bacterium]
MSAVATVSDLAPGEARAYEVDGVAIVLVRDYDGGFHALDELCTHEAISLADGDVEDCTIECWKHGSAFSLLTGKPTSLPATRPVNVYPVTIDGDDVMVETQPATRKL